MAITHVVIHVHECTMFFLVFLWEVQCSSSRGTVWKSSSSSSSSEHPGVLSGVLLSAELNDSHLHTSLGGVCGVFLGVTGAQLNEACSMLETWWILGVFLVE